MTKPAIPEPESQMPVTSESRVDRIELIVNSLSDFEQDELRMKLGVRQQQDYCRRLLDWRNSLALGLHSMIYCGVFFGIFMGTFAGIATGLQAGLVAGLAVFAGTALGAGFFFGLLMAAYMIGLMRFFMPRFTKNLRQQRSAAFQVHELQLPLPAPEAFEVCLSSLSATKGIRLEAIDRENGTVRGISPLSWRSPGEVVGAKIDSIAPDVSRVRVYSKALFTILDFGKNRANVFSLSKSIEDAGQVHAVLRLP